jgi:hypothetical protein
VVDRPVESVTGGADEPTRPWAAAGIDEVVV